MTAAPRYSTTTREMCVTETGQVCSRRKGGRNKNNTDALSQQEMSEGKSFVLS